jgi:flagellar basal body rod protein FlgC
MVDIMIAKRAYEANAKAFHFISATEDWPFSRGF